MTALGSVYQQAKKSLEHAGIDTPALDARLIIQHHTGLTSADFIGTSDHLLTTAQTESIRRDIARRVAGEPVFRILGEREFHGLPFKVTPDTLDPRPDTETVVNLALQTLTLPSSLRDAGSLPLPQGEGRGEGVRILDLGTGTGCILISLLHEWPNATGVGIDISPAAVKIARENALRNGVETRAEFRVGSWFEPVKGDEKFDLIVSNPPYIEESDIENLAVEVRNHDPILALSGGIDGLDAYKSIIPNLKKHLFPGGRVFLEMGFSQMFHVKRLVDESNATLIREHLDLAGISRVIEITYGEN